MSFVKRIAEYEKPRTGARCYTCMVIESVSAEERDAILAAMDDPRISHAGLSRIFREEGHEIGETSIRRHRNGECKGI